VIVAGGYNSSNTSHLVELCEEKLPTYFIESVNKILDKQLIRHYDLHTKEETVTERYHSRKNAGADHAHLRRLLPRRRRGRNPASGCCHFLKEPGPLRK
jgi:hypothetical protein